MYNQIKKLIGFSLVLVTLLCLSILVYAVDGVIEINQAMAMAGGVTLGDAPGFLVAINKSSSYRLTGNLKAWDFDTNAIEVDTVNVTIDPEEFNCTEVLGFSQTGSWFEKFNEPVLGIFQLGHWQGRMKAGAGINEWSDPDFSGYDQPLHLSGLDYPEQDGLYRENLCDREEVDRVVLTISGSSRTVDQWSQKTLEAVQVIRDKYPNVAQIVLQPVVGGPNHFICQFWSEKKQKWETIRASSNHPDIDLAIASVISNDVVAGVSPEVESCDQYADRVGHLTEEGTIFAADNIEMFYGGTPDVPNITSIQISPTNATIDAGFTLQFTAIGKLSNNNTIDITNSATWNSSNSTVANINQGLVQGLEVGFTDITATKNDITSNSAVLEVEYPINHPPLALISIKPKTLTIGETMDVTVEGTGFQDGATVKICRGGDITINQVTFINPTELIANITVPNGIQQTSCNAKITNPDGDVSDILRNAVTISN